jgi:hypothetical protein
MRAKSVNGMSIGFELLASKNLTGGGRELTAIRLHEISLVTFGANPDARVQTVKSFADCTDERELKNLLRERDCLSRSKATAAADALWRILRGGDDTDFEYGVLAEHLKNLHQSLKGTQP